MYPEFVVSIDVGTTKISVLVGEFYDDGTMKIIGAASQPSLGITKGQIVNMEEAAACIERVKVLAGRMAGVEIDGICAGISGPHIRSFNSRGVIALTPSPEGVSQADIDRVLEAAGNITLPAEMEIIHTLPQDFMVDRQRGIRDPMGMVSEKLGAEVHVVTAQTAQIENFMKVLEKAGIDVMNIVFEPVATAMAVLSAEEREAGSLLVDIGGGITSYALYHDGAVRSSGVVPAGGVNITKDLAIGLRVPASVAEQIKIDHGLALSSIAGDDDTVVVPGMQENGGSEIRKNIIAAIIEPRCEEIFTMIKSAVSKDPCYRMLGGGVVLTGGGARIEGMGSVAGQVFDMPVRMGLPRGLEGLAEIVAEGSWSAGVGLLHYEAEKLRLERAERGRRGRVRWMLSSIKRIASMF